MFESLLKNINSIITARLADVKNKEKRVSKIISNTFEMWFDFLKYGHTNPFLKLLQNPAPYCQLFLSFLGGVRDEIVNSTGADSGESEEGAAPISALTHTPFWLQLFLYSFKIYVLFCT